MQVIKNRNIFIAHYGIYILAQMRRVGICGFNLVVWEEAWTHPLEPYLKFRILSKYNDPSTFFNDKCLRSSLTWQCWYLNSQKLQWCKQGVSLKFRTTDQKRTPLSSVMLFQLDTKLICPKQSPLISSFLLNMEHPYHF